MDLIVEVDRNHRISRSVDILRCKKGSIPICPFTVTCILIGITVSIALKRSLVANQHFANLMIENGIFEAIPKHSRGYIEAEHYVLIKRGCYGIEEMAVFSILYSQLESSEDEGLCRVYTFNYYLQLCPLRNRHGSLIAKIL